MSSNDNNCCPVWPSISPYYGGPFPTRLWSRASLPCAPLSDADRQALDMRRKAETLQHRPNENQLSKSQKWSRVNRGFGPSRRRSWATQNWTYTDPNTYKLPLNSNILTCSGESVISAPASASDVPGGGVLTYDPSIPLSGWRVQRQYLAGGTKWPQSTTNIPVPRQYYVENVPNPILCGPGGPTPDPSTWVTVNYTSSELAPSSSTSISRIHTTTTGGDYEYLCVLLGKYNDLSGIWTTPPSSYTSTVTVNASVLGVPAVDEVGILGLAGGGGGGSTDISYSTYGSGGGGGAAYSISRPISGQTVYTVAVGQGGYDPSGNGGPGGRTQVTEDATLVLDLSGGGGGETGGPSPAAGVAGVVDVPSAPPGQNGGAGGARDAGGVPISAAEASTCWNASVPVPKAVWNEMLSTKTLWYDSVKADVATASLGGGGTAGAPPVLGSPRWGSPAIQNRVHPGGAGGRVSASGTSNILNPTWGAGGGGAPLNPVTGNPGTFGGNGFVLMWFRHPTNK